MKKTLATITAPLELVLGNHLYTHFLELWEKKALSESELAALGNALTEYDYVFKRAQLERMLAKVREAYEKLKKLPYTPGTQAPNAWLAAAGQVVGEEIPDSRKSLVETMAFKLCLALISMLKKEVKPENFQTSNDEDSQEEYETISEEFRSNSGPDDSDPDEPKLDPSEMTIEEQVKHLGLNPDTYF